jgi:hypothetical protein
MRSEIAQPVECRIWLKRSPIVGERHKRSRIQSDLQLLGESTLEARVQANTSALEGDFNIVAPTTKPHRAHQERPGVIDALVLPLDEADAKRNSVKAPGVVKL